MRVLLALAIVLLATANGPASAQVRVFFGNLHSHTSYSDGSGTPDEAYRHARDVAGLHFLAITEHHHARAETGATADRRDHILIATRPELYNGDPQSLVAAAQRFNEDDRFVAIYGQEFSSINVGNHVNVFGIDTVIPVASGFFRALTVWLEAHPDDAGEQPLIQFNHPSDFDNAAKEYGADDFGSRSNWVRRMDGFAELIEVLNGPAMTKVTGKRPTNVMSGDYLEYLNLGFHVAPTADQDNHYQTWGNATDARTGVIAPELTRPAIMRALRERHVYASEDRNLEVIARVNGHLMGDIITDPPAGGSDLQIEITLRDPDEPTARYRVQVFSDRRPGGPAAVPIKTFTFQGDVQNRALVGLNFQGVGQYLFLSIRQTNANGTFDRVWTAPVWFAAN